jgi:hypothetical protein
MPGGSESQLVDAVFGDWIGNREPLTSTTVPIQLPDVQIPAGTVLFFIASTDNVNNIFFGRNRPQVLNTTHRLTLTPGEGRTFAVRNANLFWFLPTTANDAVEWMVEIGQRLTTGVVEGASIRLPAQTEGPVRIPEGISTSPLQVGAGAVRGRLPTGGTNAVQRR